MLPSFNFENLLHRFADFCFVDRLIEVLDRFFAMTFEFWRCLFHMSLRSAHRFQRFMNMWMRRHRRSYRGWRRSHNRSRGNGGLGSSSCGGEGEREQKGCHDEQSGKADLFQVFLLVRLAARTQPV